MWTPYASNVSSGSLETKPRANAFEKVCQRRYFGYKLVHFIFVFKLIYIFKLALTLHNFRMQVHCRSDLASHKNANIGAVRILRARCSLEVAIGKSQPKSRRLPENRLLKKTKNYYFSTRFYRFFLSAKWDANYFNCSKYCCMFVFLFTVFFSFYFYAVVGKFGNISQHYRTL